ATPGTSRRAPASLTFSLSCSWSTAPPVILRLGRHCAPGLPDRTWCSRPKSVQNFGCLHHHLRRGPGRDRTMASASRQQEAARGLTLARAVETLGQGIVEVLTAPAGLDVEIHGRGPVRWQRDAGR